MPINVKNLLLPAPSLHGIDKDDVRYKVVFLNSVFFFAGVVAFGMGFVRLQKSLLLGVVDFGFSVICFGLLYYLNRHKQKIELVSTVAIVCCFVLFYTIYLFAPYNTARISLFFLLLASAFFLKGRKVGLFWLGIILAALALGHFLPFANTGYLGIDLLTTSLYLVALIFIFNNYEVYKEESNAALHESHKQLKLLVETLEKSEGRFRSLFEQAAVGIAIAGTDGRFLMANPKYCRFLGYSENELLQLSVMDVTCPEDRAVGLEYMRQQLAGKIDTYTLEKRYLQKNGSSVWGNLTVSMLKNKDGLPIFYIGIIEDITLRKQLEQEVTEIGERQLRHIGMELHDNLGQQLTGISLLAKSLENSLGKKKLEEAQSVAALVANLNQAVATVRSMAHGLYVHENDHRGIAVSLKRLAEQTETLSGIPCRIEAPPTLPNFKPEIILHLYRTVQEAISNAIRHSKPTRIDIDVMKDGESNLSVTVANDGCPNAPINLDGNGMGIRMMRHRCNLIGATLVIDPHPGEGMNINIHLPYKPENLAPNPLNELS